jgi:hypothetical protein
MRRERRQTGSTRVPKDSKMAQVNPWTANAPPGPFPWDRYLPGTQKPSNRALRRSFGVKMDSRTRKA